MCFFVSTVTKYSQSPCAGCSAALIAASPGLSIGVGGSPVRRQGLGEVVC